MKNTNENTNENAAESEIKAKEKTSLWLPVVYLPLIFLYDEIMLRLMTAQDIAQHLIYPVIFAVSLGLLLSSLLSFLPPKADRILTAVILFLIGLLFSIECLVKGNFQTYMDLESVMNSAGNVIGEYAGSLSSAIIGGLLQILIFFTPAVLYLALGTKLRVKRSSGIPLLLKAYGVFAAVVLFVLGSLMIRFGEEKSIYRDSYEFNAASETFGLITGLRLSIAESITGNSRGGGFITDVSANTSGIKTPETLQSPQESQPLPAPEEPDTASEMPASGEPDPTEAPDSEEPSEMPPEPVITGENTLPIDLDAIISDNPDKTVRSLSEYVKTLTPSPKNKYTGLFQGKNLILICAEAFSDSVINEELTPTLYRLSHNGIYFSEYYQPSWGGSTSSGEYSFLMGLVPHSGMKSMQQTQNTNNYFTLASQLGRQGYATCAYHNGVHTFYNRHLTHEKLGFDQYLAFGNGLEELMSRHAADTTLFDKTLDGYLDGQPFCLYYMTISGHCIYQAGSPFVRENLSRVTEVYPDRYKDKTLYYLCYQMELEHALTKLVEKLEAAGIANDTVICLTSDHFPYGLEKSEAFQTSENYVPDLYGYSYSQPWEKDHNAWLLWSGCLEQEAASYACEVSSPTYSLDIVPTLSNLFGLDYDSRLLVGRDVFSEEMPLAIWNTYSWVTEEGYYNAQSKKYIPREGREYDKDYVSRINNIVHNKVLYSYQVMDCDYFGALFPKTGE